MAKRIVAVLADLIFAVRITDAAKRAGVEIALVKTLDAALEQSPGAALVILDLDFAPPEWIAKLKQNAAPMIGYVSHVQTDVIKSAREAGCETILARSAFVQKLAEIVSL